MRIHQPMLFVGLGGTGCHIGAELERRLRDGLCGPDGTALFPIVKDSYLLPYQLPACLQFVYADLNQAELDGVRRRVVPTEQHLPAVDRTAHYVHNLVPQHHTYPEVARSLRLNADRYVGEWLPPAAGEPRVAPLARGAGQLPTVGRAALFETLRSGVAPAQLPLTQAIGEIATSGAQLHSLGGQPGDTCDVFVAFSVAGGTGAGIFFDYLHLIGDALKRAKYRAQIYPLVLMPSAFDEGRGGGRFAVLNAGRSLLDLFRLIDDQNGQAAHVHLDDVGLVGQLAVHYPVDGEKRLDPSTVQTAFLFSRTPGVEREDLHRSVVSLILSLLGTGLEPDGEHAQIRDRLYQSFADDFINRGVEREQIAISGVGNRGVSTALVASMTVPVDELADVISSRLLARAVEELRAPPPGAAEDNGALIDQFFAASGLEPLRQRQSLKFTEPPQPAQGADAIRQALRRRSELMVNTLESLDLELRQSVPDLASSFDYRRAVDALLGSVDLLRVHRVALGDQRLPDPVSRGGFSGQLERRRVQPLPPDGLEFNPPAPRPIRDRRGVPRRRARWSDPPVGLSLGDQNVWYRWRSHQIWHRHWSEQAPRWDRAMGRLRQELGSVVDALIEHARGDERRFAQRTQDLYSARTGVSYLLPPHGDLESFYQSVVRRFASRHNLRPVTAEADIVTTLVGAEGWRTAYRLAYDRAPEQAVQHLRSLLKQEIKRLFVQYGNYADEQPLLPALAHLLARAAGREGAPVGDDDLAQFRQKLAGMIPGGFSPQGTGKLKVLVGYPAGGQDAQIERYLGDRLHLPRESDTVVEFRPLDTESIAVVLFRTSMSVTEVPELRSVLHQWVEAVAAEHTQDYLAWRQRLGYDYGWLVTTEEHRVGILHRLLCAMWNGQVEVLHGPAQSPAQVRIRLGPREAVAMTLNLRGFDNASSWGSLVRAYEEWTLTDDQAIRRDFCERLMETLPEGLTTTLVAPSSLFEVFVQEVKPAQVKLLRKLDADRVHWVRHLLTFWDQTTQAALDLPFARATSLVRGTLGDLFEATRS